jgi:hypothetical protein
VKQRSALEASREAHSVDLVWRPVIYRAAVELDHAARRRHQAGDHVEQRGLTGTVWANNGMALTAWNLEAHALDNLG